MICVPLTDWTTVRGASTLSPLSFVSNEARWLDLAAFQDLVAFLEVKDISLGGATTLSLTYQTAPTKDDSLFVDLAAITTLATGLTVTKMLKDSLTNPLSRWLRWKLDVSSGSPSSNWGATFRVWVAANLSSSRSRVPLAVDTAGRMVPNAPSAPLGGGGPRNGGAGCSGCAPRNGGAGRPPAAGGGPSGLGAQPGGGPGLSQLRRPGGSSAGVP